MDIEDTWYGSPNTGSQFDKVADRMNHAKSFLQFIVEFLKAKASVEEECARQLLKLAKLGATRETTRSLGDCWRTVLESTERQSVSHQRQRLLLKEVVTDLSGFALHQDQHRKLVNDRLVQSQAQKLQQQVKSAYEKVIKTNNEFIITQETLKGHQHQMTNMGDVKQKEIDKARKQLNKLNKSLAAAAGAYNVALSNFQSLRKQWNNISGSTYSDFSRLEAERLLYTQKCLWRVTNGDAECLSELDETLAAIRQSILKCNHEGDFNEFLPQRIDVQTASLLNSLAPVTQSLNSQYHSVDRTPSTENSASSTPSTPHHFPGSNKPQSFRPQPSPVSPTGGSLPKVKTPKTPPASTDLSATINNGRHSKPVRSRSTDADTPNTITTSTESTTDTRAMSPVRLPPVPHLKPKPLPRKGSAATDAMAAVGRRPAAAPPPLTPPAIVVAVDAAPPPAKVGVGRLPPPPVPLHKPRGLDSRTGSVSSQPTNDRRPSDDAVEAATTTLKSPVDSSPQSDPGQVFFDAPSPPPGYSAIVKTRKGSQEDELKSDGQRNPRTPDLLQRQRSVSATSSRSEDALNDTTLTPNDDGKNNVNDRSQPTSGNKPAFVTEAERPYEEKATLNCDWKGPQGEGLPKGAVVTVIWRNSAKMCLVEDENELTVLIPADMLTTNGEQSKAMRL